MSAMSNQFRRTRPPVTWLFWITAPTENAQVTRKKIPRTSPTGPWQRKIISVGTPLSTVTVDVPVRSILGRIMFKRRSGCRHTIERARVTVPAARRVRLKNHQLSISFFDGMLL